MDATDELQLNSNIRCIEIDKEKQATLKLKS